jgi:enediyne biosynthesis protein E5
MLGTRLNLLFTGRIPTVLSWLGTFLVLAVIRAWFIQKTPIAAQLVVLTGIPLVLFTFYMITDPQTSPSRIRSQILFGGGIALAYSVLLLARVQYTMFYAVTAICALRGLWLAASNWWTPVPQPATAAATGD